MKRIAKKWYISLLVVPIVLTYLTSFIQLPDILSNWEYSLIFTLSILSSILFYEIQVLKKQITDSQTKPTERDKEIIKNLLATLNLKVFHEDIYNQDAWYGYRQDAIHNIIEFKYDSELIENKTSVAHLNNLISDFRLTLDEFTEFSSNKLYGRNAGWLIPFKDDPENHPREKVKAETEKMNALSKICFGKLETLMTYLRDNDYL